MRSAGRYLERVVAESLAEFVEEYDSSTVSVGILQGNVNLRNLRLKRRNLYLAEGLELSIVHGCIGSLAIRIPWSHLQSGDVKISVNEVHLVCRIPCLDSTASATELRTQFQDKMHAIEREEWAYLGIPYTRSGNLASRIVESLKSTFLSNLMNGVSISITSVQISLLLPLPQSQEVAHTIIRMSEFSAQRSLPHSLSKTDHIPVLNKEFDIRNMSVEISRIADGGDILSFYKSLGTNTLSSLVINPAHVMATLSVMQDTNDVTSPDMNVSKIKANIRINNIECTPNMSQILVMRDSISSVIIARRRSRYLSLRPRYPPSSSNGNVREWWQYAAAAVMIGANGGSAICVGPCACKNTEREGGFQAQTTMRSRYISLYRQAIECALESISHPVAFAEAQQHGRASSPPWALSRSDSLEMDEMHKAIPSSSLLTYRLMVHQGLRNAGMTEHDLKACVSYSASPSTSLWTSLYRRLVSVISKPGSSQPDDIDAQILGLFKEIKDKTTDPKKYNRVMLDLSLTIPRLALALHDTLTQYDHSRSGNGRESIQSAATIVLYGMQSSYQRGELVHDGVLSVRLGSVRLFGESGVELFSCGLHTDRWLNNYEVQCALARDLALSLQLQWYVINRHGFFGERGASSKILTELNATSIEKLTYGNKRHIVLEASVATLRINWHKRSLLFFLRKYAEYTESMPLNVCISKNTFLQKLKEGNPLMEIRRKCAQCSINKSIVDDSDCCLETIKWSVGFALQGVVISVPLNCTDLDDHWIEDCNRLQLSCEAIHGQCGDFLANLDTSGVSEDSPAVSRPIWLHVEQVISLSLASMGPIVRPVVVSVKNVDLSILENAREVKITKAPFSCKYVLSSSAFPGHHSTPDLQVDIYGSPLEIVFSIQTVFKFCDALDMIFPPLSAFLCPDSSEVYHHASAPRMKCLAPLCWLKMTIVIDYVMLELQSEDIVDARNYQADIVRSFANIISDQGAFSRVAHTAERHAILRISRLGTESNVVESSLRALTSALEQRLDSDDIDVMVSDTIDSLNPYPSRSSDLIKPIFSFRLSGVECTATYLTYDTRKRLCIRELLVSDQDFSPILHIFSNATNSEPFAPLLESVPRDKRHGFQTFSKKWAKRATYSKQNLKAAVASGGPVAISATYSEYDSSYGYGYGGENVNYIYDASCEWLRRPRSGELTINVQNIDLLLTPQGLPFVVKGFLPLCKGLSGRWRNYEWLHGDANCSDEGLPRSFFVSEKEYEVDLMSHVYVSCGHVVLETTGQYLAEGVVTDVSIDISNLNCIEQHVFKLNRGDTKFPTCHISSEVVELHDLSPAGTLHPSVVSKEMQSHATMCTLKFTLRDGVVDIRLTLNDIRVCLLCRFLTEIIDFCSTFFLKRLLQEVSAYEEILPSISSLARGRFSEHSVSSSVSDHAESHRLGPPEVISVGSTMSIHIFRIIHRILAFAKFLTPGPLFLKYEHRGHTFTSLKLNWQLEMHRLALCLPRNTVSDDMVGVTVEHVLLTEKNEPDTWSDPEKVAAADGETLFFDCAKNEWVSSALVSSEGESTEGDTSATEDYSDVEIRYAPDISKLPQRKTYLGRLFGTTSCSTQSDDGVDFSLSLEENKARFEAPQKLFARDSTVDVEVDSLESDSSDDEFQDTIEGPAMHSSELFNSHSAPNVGQPIFTKGSCVISACGAGFFSRYVATLSDIHIYCCLCGSSTSTFSSGDHYQDKHRRFLRIQPDCAVYSVLYDGKSTRVLSRERWKQLTCLPVSTQVIVDCVDKTNRIIISEFETPSPIELKISISEMYLLLSVYYDNFFEDAALLTSRPNPLDLDEGTKTHKYSPLCHYPQYGTREYCEYLRRSSSCFDILFIRSSISVECSMDSHAFDSPPDWLKHFDGEDWHSSDFTSSGLKRVPFASLNLRWISLKCRIGRDVSQIALGVGNFHFCDTRPSQQVKGENTINLSASKLPLHGYADLDYGLNHGPSSISTSLDIPVKISVFAVTNSWCTCNIGVNSPDSDFRNFDALWLLYYFFSLYFRFPEYGNPAVAAKNTIAVSEWPYGGLDFRVFVVDPHLQISENMGSGAQSVVIEAASGMYFRYMNDSNGSIRCEMHVNDLALMMVKVYKPSSETRGIRGTSGSGRGVRTVLEFIDFKFNLHYDKVLCHLDIIVSVSPSATALHSISQDQKKHSNGLEHNTLSDVPTYINFDDESLELPFAASSAKCITPFVAPSRSFPRRCCHIVSSYEDLLFGITLISDVVGLKNIRALFKIPGKSSKIGKGGTSSEYVSVFSVIKIQFVKMIVVDNVLGLHLPLVQLYLNSIDTTVDFNPLMDRTSKEKLPGDKDFSSADRMSASSDTPPQLNRDSFTSKTPFVVQSRLRQCCNLVAWADYFNNVLKCWEPLLEPIQVAFLHEQNPERGVGYTLRVQSCIHFNITVIMVRIVCELARIIEDVIKKLRRQSQKENEEYSVDAAMLEQVSCGEREATTSFRSRVRRSIRLSRGALPDVDNNALTPKNTVYFRYGMEHFPTASLKPTARVGFSCLNLTGYPIRYLQIWEDGNRHTVQYLQDGERGLLNFIASNTLIRDNEIVEESFSVQTIGVGKTTSLKRMIGHQVALQVAGYKWLRAVQADTLGTRFESLTAVSDKLGLNAFLDKWEIRNALKLVTTVEPRNGGRLLTLSSPFMIKNSTNHPIYVLAHSECNLSQVIDETPFFVPAGECFNVPIALFHCSVLESGGRSLGYLWITPAEKRAIIDELGVSSHMISRASYSSNPIDVMKIVRKSGRNTHLNSEQLSCQLLSQSRSRKAGDDKVQLDSRGSLFLASDDTKVPVPTRNINFDNLPTFCYNVEIECHGGPKASRDGELSNINGDDGTFTSGKLSDILFSQRDREINKVPPPCIYSIVIHPTIILENLLPVRATFELGNASHKSLLWSSSLEPGQTISIHTVSLDKDIVLSVNLNFCLSSESVLVHRLPLNNDDENRLANTVHKTFEGLRGFLDDKTNSDSSILLTDSAGQRLRLQIENTLGGGGNRSIVVYCPYWVVNTSQYTLRLREDGAQYLPAGTVSAKGDGRVPVAAGRSHSQSTDHEALRRHPPQHSTSMDRQPYFGERVFPGCPGPLHSTNVKEIKFDSPLKNLLHDLQFNQLLDMSSMFNFEPSDSRILGTQKVIAQLDDSNWSESFTLESAGVKQVLSVDHAERGMLELAFKVATAPGRLAKYTKIIRFSPRFVVVNKLKYSTRIVQTNGFTFDKVPIHVSANHLRPFHLPAVFGERQVAIEVSGPWMRSVPFDVDNLQSYTLRLRPNIDTSTIDHIPTRGTPEYDVILPAGEVGIWFETDWSQEQIVVKRIRPGSVAATKTDIQTGDVLLAVDNVSISQSPFEDVMQQLKEKQSQNGCTLTLRTVEEKLRLLRDNALIADDTEHKSFLSIKNTAASGRGDMDEISSSGRDLDIHVQMRAVDSTIFLTISELDRNILPEYRVANYSSCYTLHYRQKGVRNGKWSSLDPGLTAPYIFEDPTKPRRLLLRIGKNTLCPTAGRLNALAKINDNVFSCLAVGEENNVVSVLFDEIGYECMVPIAGVDAKLNAVVKSKGPTKVLQISPDECVREVELKYCLGFICEQIALLNLFVSDLDEDKRCLKSPVQSKMMRRLVDIQSKQRRCKLIHEALYEERLCDLVHAPPLTPSCIPFESLLGPVVSNKDTILVEVLEATGLKSSSLGGAVEAYCELELKMPSSMLWKEFRQSQRTYINDEIIDPHWVDQIFVFNVPVSPAHSIRGYYIRVTVKSRTTVGTDSFLGHTDIPFTSLQSENELLGWFPLKPRKNSIRASPESLQVTGSIKLRAQWIHSTEALVKHIKDAALSRIDELSSQLSVQQKHLRVMLDVHRSIPEAPQKHLRNAFMKPTVSRRESKWVDDSGGDESMRKARSTPVPVKRRSKRHMGVTSGLTSVKSNRVASSTRLSPSYFHGEYRAVKCHTSRLRRMLATQQHLPKGSRAMTRKEDAILKCERFVESIELEVKRSFDIVNTTTGTIEVTPIRAINVPQFDRPVYVQLTYGDNVSRTFSVVPEVSQRSFCTQYEWLAVHLDSGPDCIFCGPRFVNNNSIQGGENYHVFESLTKLVEIDTLNLKGSLGVTIMEERFPKPKEVAHVDIPMFSILESTCIVESEFHTLLWFPLTTFDSPYNSSSRLYENICTPGTDSGVSLIPHICISFRWLSRYVNVKCPRLYGYFQLPALSFSVVDTPKSQEVMQINIRDVVARHVDTLQYTESSLNVSWFQVDNHLPDCKLPVIVCLTPERRPQPGLRIHVRRNNNLCHDHLESYDMIELILQELDMNLEQQTVAALWDIAHCILRDSMSRTLELSTSVSSKIVVATEVSRSLPDEVMSESKVSADVDDDKVYVDHFYIAPIKINLSLITNSHDSLISTAKIDSITTPNGIHLRDMSPVSLFLWQVGEVVLELTSTISDAPVKLNGMAIDNLFRTWTEIISTLQEHYLNSSLGQIYRIVGSLDLVSSPVGLLSSLGIGVRDFFYEPTHALITNPTEFRKIGKGVVKGAVSLASKTADGLIGTTTIATRYVSKSVAILTMDDAFLRSRERLNKHSDGLLWLTTRPVQDIANGLYCGVVGVLRVPYYGATRNGATGFVTGLCKGVAGVATKPLVGVLDAVTHTGEGVRHLVKVLNRKRRNVTQEKVRYSSIFGPDGRLLPYSHSVAYGAHILRHLNMSGTKASGLSFIAQRGEKFKQVSVSNIYDGSGVSSSSRWSRVKTGLQRRMSSAYSGVSFTESMPLSRKQNHNVFDMHGISGEERVVYASILSRNNDDDFVVIVTTARVIFAKTWTSKGPASAEVVWYCNIRDIKSIILLHDDEKYSSLVFSTDFVEDESPDRKLAGERTMMEDLANCLNTVIHKFDRVDTTNVLYEETDSIIHIGPWQYMRPGVKDTDNLAEDDLDDICLKQLENSSWVVFEEHSDRVVPTWLRRARVSAVSAHLMATNVHDIGLSSECSETATEEEEPLQERKLSACSQYIDSRGVHTVEPSPEYSESKQSNGNSAGKIVRQFGSTVRRMFKHSGRENIPDSCGVEGSRNSHAGESNVTNDVDPLNASQLKSGEGNDFVETITEGNAIVQRSADVVLEAKSFRHPIYESSNIESPKDENSNTYSPHIDELTGFAYSHECTPCADISGTNSACMSPISNPIVIDKSMLSCDSASDSDVNISHGDPADACCADREKCAGNIQPAEASDRTISTTQSLQYRTDESVSVDEMMKRLRRVEKLMTVLANTPDGARIINDIMMNECDPGDS